jgi:hypothetical protein
LAWYDTICETWGNRMSSSESSGEHTPLDYFLKRYWSPDDMEKLRGGPSFTICVISHLACTNKNISKGWCLDKTAALVRSRVRVHLSG